MLTFSPDAMTAETQMRAVIFYLTTFGYIDGDFDLSEKAFVSAYIGRLIRHRIDTSAAPPQGELREELIAKYTKHFAEVFQSIDAQVKDLFTESVAEGEDQDQFVHAKLKLRCFEFFKSFDKANQEQLMETIDELVAADGQVHPAEEKFRGELAELLQADLGIELLDESTDLPPAVEVRTAAVLPPATENHPFFEQFEHHYTAAPDRLQAQVAADRKLIDDVIQALAHQRAAGQGKLAGKDSVLDFLNQTPPVQPFLDGHVHVIPPQPGVRYELTVLGDLHGCYSCLKAALMQSDFFGKVNRYRADPSKHPFPKLILLGDYIDRGLFSYHGILRAAMQLYLRAPEHVVLLRGNHEYYIEHQGRVYGAVRPSEAMDTLRSHFSVEVFRHYMQLFDALPNMVFFDRFFFVHGGIPRDRTMKEKYKDLSSLNNWDIRFEMMWSDPSLADVIPTALQEQTARFPFGRLQSLAFMQRIGCHTLIRGHEKIDEGFRRVYEEDGQLLISLFSSGGADNEDLPEDSSYRTVTPMALTLTWHEGQAQIVPWPIDYRPYNDPSRNGFYLTDPEIEHRST